MDWTTRCEIRKQARGEHEENPKKADGQVLGTGGEIRSVDPAA